MNKIDWNTLDVTRTNAALTLIFSEDRDIDKTTVVKVEKSHIWRLIWLLLKGRVGITLEYLRENFFSYYETKH